MNLPPELVHKLSEPSSFFWLQPLATIVAALLAIGGAVIAYRAVKCQIDAAAAQQPKNRDAEWARMRRTEVLDLLLDVRNLARKLASIARTYSLATDPDDLRLKEKRADSDEQAEDARAYRRVNFAVSTGD